MKTSPDLLVRVVRLTRAATTKASRSQISSANAQNLLAGRKLSQGIRAFTLVEMLLVLGIVIILLAIAFPSVNSFREAGARVVCINNQKQIVSAMRLYANDHDGFLPFPNWGTQGVAGTRWLYEPPDMTLPEHAQNGALWPYLKNNKVLVCPIDKPGSDILAQRSQKLSSYSLNGAICGYGAKGDDTYKMMQFPASAIAMWEQDEGPGSFWFNDAANYPTERITLRHKNGAPVGCFDGHVEWLLVSAFDDAAVAKPGRLWCSPRTSTGE